MHLAHRADGPALHQLDHTAVVRPRVNLRPHLRDRAAPGGQIGDHPRLVHGVGQRLLAVHVEASTQCHGRGRGVGVVGGADHGRIQSLQLGKHLPEVAEQLRVAADLLVRRLQEALIDVAETDDLDIFLDHAAQVVTAAVANPHHRDAELVARTPIPAPRLRGGAARQEQGAGDQARGLEKPAARRAAHRPSSVFSAGSGRTMMLRNQA